MPKMLLRYLTIIRGKAWEVSRLCDELSIKTRSAGREKFDQVHDRVLCSRWCTKVPTPLQKKWNSLLHLLLYPYPVCSLSDYFPRCRKLPLGSSTTKHQSRVDCLLQCETPFHIWFIPSVGRNRLCGRKQRTSLGCGMNS